MTIQLFLFCLLSLNMLYGMNTPLHNLASHPVPTININGIPLVSALPARVENLRNIGSENYKAMGGNHSATLHYNLGRHLLESYNSSRLRRSGPDICILERAEEALQSAANLKHPQAIELLTLNFPNPIRLQSAFHLSWDAGKESLLNSDSNTAYAHFIKALGFMPSGIRDLSVNQLNNLHALGKMLLGEKNGLALEIYAKLAIAGYIPTQEEQTAIQEVSRTGIKNLRSSTKEKVGKITKTSHDNYQSNAMDLSL